MLVENELDEGESVEETMAAVHAWLVFMSRELRTVRRMALAILVALLVCAAAAVVVAIVVFQEFGVT